MSAKGFDFICYSCLHHERVYAISKIKRHYTFQSLFAFETYEDIRFICSNSLQVQGLLYFFRMKLLLISLVLCATIYVACGMKLLASSSRQLNRRETKLVKRLGKRQVPIGKIYQTYIDFSFISNWFLLFRSKLRSSCL